MNLKVNSAILLTVKLIAANCKNLLLKGFSFIVKLYPLLQKGLMQV